MQQQATTEPHSEGASRRAMVRDGIRIFWSAHDRRFVGVCLLDPDLRCAAATAREAYEGVRVRRARAGAVKPPVTAAKQAAGAPPPGRIHAAPPPRAPHAGGATPQPALAGELTIRVGPRVHRRLQEEARARNMPLSVLVRSKLAAW